MSSAVVNSIQWLLQTCGVMLSPNGVELRTSLSSWFKQLNTLAICPWCILRLTASMEAFSTVQNPDDLLKQICAGLDCDDLVAPKLCSVCLNMMACNRNPQWVDENLIAHLRSADYDATVCCINVTVPPALLVRDRLMQIHAGHALFDACAAVCTGLGEQGKKNITQSFRKSMIELKNGVRSALAQSVLAALPHLRHDTSYSNQHPNAPLWITLVYACDKIAHESDFLGTKHQQPAQQKKRGRDHHDDEQRESGQGGRDDDGNENESATIVESAAAAAAAVAQVTMTATITQLNFLNDVKFLEKCAHVSLSDRSVEGAQLRWTVSTAHQSIFFAGRYNKYARNVSQTPWLLDEDERPPITSVQDLLCEPLKELSRAVQLKFMSAGREDVDVRMLGHGRPFVIELVDPHRTLFTAEELANLQEDINKNALPKGARLSDLQLVKRVDVEILKNPEIDKQKSYLAVVCTSRPLTQEEVDRIASCHDVVLKQWTPVRVLHRRPLLQRERTIHSMKLIPIAEHPQFFALELTTQAGTYIKEFVHSDLGRTYPSLSTVLGGDPVDCDILSLDVLRVDFPWPPTLTQQTAAE